MVMSRSLREPARAGGAGSAVVTAAVEASVGSGVVSTAPRRRRRTDVAVAGETAKRPPRRGPVRRPSAMSPARRPRLAMCWSSRPAPLRQHLLRRSANGCSRRPRRSIPRGRKIDARSTQVTPRRGCRVEDVLRVGSALTDGVNRVLLPGRRQELHRTDSAIEAGVSVQGAVVGVRWRGMRGYRRAADRGSAD